MPDERRTVRAWLQEPRVARVVPVIHGSPLESLGFGILVFGLIAAVAGTNPGLPADLQPLSAYLGLLSGLGGLTLVTIGAFTRD